VAAAFSFNYDNGVRFHLLPDKRAALNERADFMENKFRIGATIAQSFEIWGRNIVAFCLVYLVVTLPGMFFEYFSGIAAFSVGEPDSQLPLAQSSNFWVLYGGVLLLQFFFEYLAAATVVYGATQYMRGHRFSIGECFIRGLSVLLPVVGVALLYTVFMAFGFLLLVIPMFFIAIIYWVCIPVAVVERPGVLASFSRSRELTHGNRWRIFGLFLFYIAVAAVLSAIIGVVFVALPAGGGLLFYMVIDFFSRVLLGSFFAVVLGVTYYNLRIEHEGVDIQELATVFD